MILTNMNNVTILFIKIISSYLWLRIFIRRNRNKNMYRAGSAFGVKDTVLCQVTGSIQIISKEIALSTWGSTKWSASPGLAYKYCMQCTCVECYNVYKNKIYILNVRIDPESAFSKLLVVFVCCIITMKWW